jgi:hypothetical protein
LAKNGITSQADIIKESYRLMNTETYRRIALIYLTQGAQVGRDMELYSGVPGFEQKFNILKNESADYASQGMKASFFNFVGAMTEPFLKPWMNVEHGATRFFQNMADYERGDGIFKGQGGFFPKAPWNVSQSSVAPIDSHTPIMMKGDVVLDGRKIGDFTAQKMADHGELPSAAPTGGDVRNPTPQPGWSWSLQ